MRLRSAAATSSTGTAWRRALSSRLERAAFISPEHAWTRRPTARSTTSLAAFGSTAHLQDTSGTTRYRVWGNTYVLFDQHLI